MLRQKVCEIFHKVQQSSASHQKYREILRNLYKEFEFDDFEIEFMRCLEIIFYQDVTPKNVHVERSLEFAATFIGSLVASEKDLENSESNNTGDFETHPFLETIIYDILEYHNLENVNARYRSCQMVDLILRNAGDDAYIGDNLWNAILRSLLLRVADIKPLVSVQAIKALSRLQSPGNSECPVIKAFLGKLHSNSAIIRKQVVELIAPVPQITGKIVERVRDSDPAVRTAAYCKCSKIGPKIIKLIDRQSVLISGFNESDECVKKYFLQDTLPKWLSAYNGDFLKLLRALKIDALEEDLIRTELICKNVMEVFFKSHPLSSVLEYLPVGDDKVIPRNKLTYESALYWNIVVDYLHKSENVDDFISSVLPDLLPFCVYVDSLIKENSEASDTWRQEELQHILTHLLQIAGRYDLGDEVGRKALHALIVNTLTVLKLNEQNIKECIIILTKMNPVLDAFTIEVCSIISDIREPLMTEKPSEEVLRKNNFKLAELRVKINILKEERDEAVAASDFEKALSVKNQLTALDKEVDEINKQFENEPTTKIAKSDTETLCQCLNIYIGILSYPKLKTLTASLRSCKDEFVLPLCDSNDLEINAKVFKCIALCCTLDRQVAQESLKLLCSPVLFYRLTTQDENSKEILLLAIAAVSDILRLYGTGIFETECDVSAHNNTTVRRRLNGTKRLYNSESEDSMDGFDFSAVTWKVMVDALVDLLDDEHHDIRERSCIAVCNLLISKIAVSPELVCRLILKWFNPLTEKYDQKLQYILGNTFVHFSQTGGIEDVLEEVVVLVLSQLANAPATSPLADVEIESALRFLAAFTSIQKTEYSHIHKNIAQSLCSKTAARPNSNCVPLYAKMLLYLDLHMEDLVVIRELSTQVKLALENVEDKRAKKNLQKFWFKLLQTSDVSEKANIVEENEANTFDGSSVRSSEEVKQTDTDNLENTSAGCSSVTEKTVDDKRDSIQLTNSKKRNSVKLSLNNNNRNNGRKSVRGSVNGSNEETILHTIIEDEEFEPESLEEDELIIETPTTSDSPNSTSSRLRLSGKSLESSDSPSSTSSRRSKRLSGKSSESDNSSEGTKKKETVMSKAPNSNKKKQAINSTNSGNSSQSAKKKETVTSKAPNSNKKKEVINSSDSERLLRKSRKPQQVAEEKSLESNSPPRKVRQSSRKKRKRICL